MEDILIHPATQQQLESYILNPAHGLLIQGTAGSGKTTLLNYVAAALLQIEISKLPSYMYLLHIEPDEKRLISIEQVRRIDHFLSRAVPGANKPKICRVVIIDGADALSIEAQNALLKNLEEPPLNTVFLLSSENLNKLLPTLRSRLTMIRLVNPKKEDVLDYLKRRGTSEAEAQRSLSISGGSLALALAIVGNSDEHPLVKAAKTAREILRGDSYERLLLVNALQKEPELAKNTLVVLEQMARIALESAEGAQADRWQKILLSSYEASSSLEQSANLRLSLTYLMLHI